jgi:Sigma-54 interaction domain
VLDDREVYPLGENRPRTVAFRLVVASNRDLRAEVAAGRFRTDLFYRVSVTSLVIPAVRERQADLPARDHQPSPVRRSRASGRRGRQITGGPRGVAAHPPLDAGDEIGDRRQGFLIVRGPLTDRLDHVQTRRISRTSSSRAPTCRR